MEIRQAISSREAKHFTTDQLRQEFLIEKLFNPGQTNMVYSHVDRIIAGGVCPTSQSLTLEAGKELAVDFFLQRRELGIINIGAKGTVIVDGTKYVLDTRDGLYVGMGAKDIQFASESQSKPAKFYFLSTPAHNNYPTTRIDIAHAEPLNLGSISESNERTIYKYIHPDGVRSCQLVMGLTILKPNNMWNTMPAHTHERRMEVYLYFDLPDDAVLFHYMGEPNETRHIVVRNEQAVISPSWSIHSGVGTRNYTFIWGMAGENQTFSDMDAVAMSELR